MLLANVMNRIPARGSSPAPGLREAHGVAHQIEKHRGSRRSVDPMPLHLCVSDCTVVGNQRLLSSIESLERVAQLQPRFRPVRIQTDCVLKRLSRSFEISG